MRTIRRNAGMTSVLAMLFLVLFGVMAIGFYAATTTAMHVTSNDERIARAFVSSESGMDFMRYHLANVSLPATTPPDQAMNELYNDLQAQLNGTGNLGSMTISKSGNTISIPAAGSRIPLDGSGVAGFRATITDWAGEIVVKIDGGFGTTEGAARAITMDFSRQEKTSNIFDYAIASKGQIQVQKGKLTSTSGVDPTIARLMSSAAVPGAVTVTGGTVGGDLDYVDGGSVIVTGGSVGGSTIVVNIMANHVHEVAPPEFPTINTSVFAAYATNTYVNGQKVQQNVYVPPNTNPKFNANDTVQGILYIDTPNQVSFEGDFSLQGFIVMAAGASTTDSLSFNGNLAMTPLPSDAQFDALRSTSGVAILAPTADVTFTGNSGGNVKGNIIVDTLSLNGSLDLTVDQGTLMTLNDGPGSFVMNTAKSVKFTATGGVNQPTMGLSYSTHYLPKPATYQEVTP